MGASRGAEARQEGEVSPIVDGGGFKVAMTGEVIEHWSFQGI